MNTAFVLRHILKPLPGRVLVRWQVVSLVQVTKWPSQEGRLLLRANFSFWGNFVWNYDGKDWVRDEGLCIIERRFAFPWEGSLQGRKIRQEDSWGSSLSFWSLWISFSPKLSFIFREMFVPYPLFPSAGAAGFFHNICFDILPIAEVLGTVILSKSHSVQYIYKLYLVIIYFSFIMTMWFHG